MTTQEPNWQRSRRCDTNTCVEVADTGPTVLVRNSTNPDGPVLSIPAQDWDGFRREILAGDYHFQ